MADDNTKKAEGQNADDESTDKSKKPNLSGEKSEKDDKKKADDGKSKTDDDDASDDAEDDPKKSAKFSQDDLDRIIKKRLKEEKDKQTREAEEAKAREKGEFEKLSNQFKTERDDLSAKLEALTEKHTKLTERVSQLVAARLKGLPEMIAALKPETDDVKVLVPSEWHYPVLVQGAIALCESASFADKATVPDLANVLTPFWAAMDALSSYCGPRDSDAFLSSVGAW